MEKTGSDSVRPDILNYGLTLLTIRGLYAKYMKGHNMAMTFCSKCGRLQDTDVMDYDELNDTFICESCAEEIWSDNQDQLEQYGINDIF